MLGRGYEEVGALGENGVGGEVEGWGRGFGELKDCRRRV